MRLFAVDAPADHLRRTSAPRKYITPGGIFCAGCFNFSVEAAESCTWR